MKLIGLLFIIVLMFVGCASQKKVKNSTPSETYTNDTTIVEDELVSPVDSVVNETIIHVVQKGESLWVIAKKYGVSVQDIVKANNIENKNIIKINQELIIPNKNDE